MSSQLGVLGVVEELDSVINRVVGGLGADHGKWVLALGRGVHHLAGHEVGAVEVERALGGGEGSLGRGLVVLGEDHGVLGRVGVVVHH